MPIQSCTLPDGGSGYKWGHSGKCYADRADAEKQAEAAYANGYAGDAALAFDRATVRRLDVDGRLHVETTPISKANICPYAGSEIPDAEALGLRPDRIYNLYRDPAELAKGAATFNNIPLLSRHVPVSADEPQSHLVVGSTGTDAEFDGVFLRNSLVVWDAIYIARVESGEQRELSSAYRYRAVMEPGEIGGEKYDGRMVDIVGNHVALVETGRAGSDVVVGDSAMESGMAKTKAALSRRAAFVKGVLTARVPLAADAKVDFSKVVAGVTAANWAKQKPALVLALDAACKGKLAKDADLADVVKLLDAMEDGAAADDMPDDVEAMDEDDETEEERKARLEKRAADKAAKDEFPDKKDDDKKDEKKGMDKKAMDAAIKLAKDEAIAHMRAIRDAETAVRPYIGEIAVAQDNAAAVYRLAFDSLNIDVTGVHESAFPAMLKMAPKPGAVQPHKIAQDAAAASTSLLKKFPGLAGIGRA